VTEAPAENIFLRYRGQARKMAALVESAAKLDGRRKARGRRDLLEVKPPATPEGNPLFRLVSGSEGCRLAETTGYLYRRAWAMRLCGRGAVGIGIRNGPAPAERVFNTTCKDRFCPTCNARHSAAWCPAVKQLLASQLGQGRRLCFVTFTIKHKKTDSLWSTRNALDRTWARFIRRKFVREVFSERLRVAEVEYTIDGGWHTHFHCLVQLRDGATITTGRGGNRKTVRLDKLPRSKLEGMVRDAWLSCSAKVGRPSFQVDLRELTVHARDKEGRPDLIRYWLRPDEVPAAKAAAKAGRFKLWTPKRHKGSPRHCWRLLTLADMADELSKYITKRNADGHKPNQLPVDRWQARQVHEYLFGVRGWNLRRATKGWEQVILESRESEITAREVEDSEKGGFEFIAWASLANRFKAAADGNLTRQDLDLFQRDCPRILNALFNHGADIAAAVLTPYAQQAFGGGDGSRPPLFVTPWQKHERHGENLATACEAAHWRKGLTRRHYRILLALHRRQSQGHVSSRIAGLGMSRKLIGEAVTMLRDFGLLELDRTRETDRSFDPARPHYKLSPTSWALLRDLPGTKSRRAAAHRSRRPKDLFAMDCAGNSTQEGCPCSE